MRGVMMAKAQADLLLAKKQWQRMKTLGIPSVSAKAYQTAEVDYQQAYAKLLAYGLTKIQIDSFLQSNNPNKADGEFTLLSLRNGTVFSANFSEGQMISPGTVLYKIVDESSLWVDAKRSSGDISPIRKGESAIIETSHGRYPARVLELHHELDAVTRTRVVRLEVANHNDQLHPGEFVTCLIKTGETPPVLAVPKATVMQNAAGESVVYAEVKPNHFKALDVKVEKRLNERDVISGIAKGTRIVTQGAFFIHAEAMKSGFETHHH